MTYKEIYHELKRIKNEETFEIVEAESEYDDPYCSYFLGSTFSLRVSW
jgi:hypothetical protein